MAIRKYVLNEDQKLTEEQTRMVREAAKRPVVVDDDNPELTDEQLSFFHRVQPPHLLQQPGESRDEPEDSAVPYGPQRYQRDDERLHTPGPGGCGCRDGQNGGGWGCPEGAGEAERNGREKGYGKQKYVQSGLNGRIAALHLSGWRASFLMVWEML